MQKLIFSLVACVIVSRAKAQLFTPESWNGTVFGGVVGGIIGNNSHGRTGEGIAIGAGAGWLLGTLVHEDRRLRGWYSPDYTYAGPPVGVSAAAPPFGVSACYGYPPPPGYPRPSYAGTGAVLGGVTGAIIGNNSHGRTAKGAAIGAGAGLLLGGITDTAVYRRQSQPPAVAPRPARPARATRPAPPVAAPVLSAPSSLIQHQIPDAPRVPDARTF